MNRPLIGTICSLYIMVACLQMLAQEPLRVDLREWGYKPPESASSRFQVQLSSQIISVGENGQIVVGFVTRDRTGLATRELPSLSFHILRFAKDGKFLCQGAVPTPSWYENAVFYGSDRTLLIRAGTKLYLFSLNMERLADRALPPTPNSGMVDWRIHALPNRDAFVLYNYRGADTSIGLLNWGDLRLLRECTYSPYDRLLSVSNRNVLTFHPTRRENPLGRTVEVGEICGSSHFSYSWEGDPTNAALVDDDSMILAGAGSSIRFVVGNKARWADTFDKKSEVVSNHIDVNANGQFVAIAVKKFTGGSEFLDISGKLKAVRVIVYEVSTGRRVSDVTPQPASSSVFDFALSPAGDVLAIVADGFLEIVPVKGRY